MRDNGWKFSKFLINLLIIHYRRNNTKTKKNKKKPVESKPEVKARAIAEEEVPAPVKPVVEKQKAAKPAHNKKSNKRKSSTKKQPTTDAAQKKQAEQKQAKATLYGLASLKRVGNVKVVPSTDFTTVKSNFVLGPLMLKVEKQTEEKRDIKMATATTHEIYGRINLRVVNGQASLHSIKVQQPKQLKVDADENKPSLRQYVGKRSANIARIVSQKLRSAVKSTLAPAA